MSTLKELDRKYDKMIDFLVELKSFMDEFMKNMDNMDRRLRRIEDKFA